MKTAKSATRTRRANIRRKAGSYCRGYKLKATILSCREIKLQRGRQRKAAVAPGVQAALQGPDALDAIFFEEQRHTGAGGFVGSSTVKHHFAVARQPVVLFFQLFGLEMQCAGNR